MAIRPKPPAFQTASITKPVIIEADVVEYLVKASAEQRWRILAQVAIATADEGSPDRVTPAMPPLERITTPAPPPPLEARRQLELVEATGEQTGEQEEVVSRVTTLPPPAPVPVIPTPSPDSVAPPAASAASADSPEDLFQAMYELMALQSASDGARFALEAALRAVPCLAGLVHLRDPATRELVVVHAPGPRAEQLLRTRTKSDALVSRAARTGKPVVVTYGAEPDAEKTPNPRHALFDPWSVVVVPVVHGGQLLGLIEMIDPVKGNPFDEDVQSALGYVAIRLGGFLAEHGTDTTHA